MKRLSPQALARLDPAIRLPAYDRDARLRVGVAHLGIGAFHRAHQAVVFDDALSRGDMRWGIVGASLRAPAVRDQLAPQDGLYTLVERDGAAERLRIIGAVSAVLVAPESPPALVEAMAQSDIQIVSLTVTEKGYRLDPASGALNAADPDVIHDLAHPDHPVTAPGFIAAAMRLRRERGLAPFTALSCDNLPDNGARLRGAVIAVLRHTDPHTADWVERLGAFPATMVDRIVPATTAADLDRLADQLGVRDEGMVKTEPFLQWVIEDQFCAARPEFEALGVQMTRSVRPWETAKLRMLNGAHSAIAYLSAISGAETVDAGVARPECRAFVERLWDEAQTTLEPTPGLDVAAYRIALMARFSNAALAHKTRQIAMDGSQKLPQRLLNTIRVRIANGQPFPALALAVAGWIRWQLGRDEAGLAFVVDDPLADQTAALLSSAGAPDAMATALLRLDSVFADLAPDPRFSLPVRTAFERLLSRGARAAMAELASSSEEVLS